MALRTFAIVMLVAQFYYCNTQESLAEKDWWQSTIFYHIYTRSFKDSDGDGVGDLRGIISKLDYLKESGVDAAWLSPIFESPMVDFGYDISNFTAIHHEYGTMEDFEALLHEANKLGIKIFLDFVPNHTSDKCNWFTKSENGEEAFKDFYVWHDGVVDEKGDMKPPNNWQSVFYGSAWTWSDKRQQYYLHQFSVAQPDLNYRDRTVQEAMSNVMSFWLDKGIAGFRVDAVNHLFEIEDLRDEPLSRKTDDPNSYDYTLHYYTKDLPESYDIIYIWREYLDDYTAANGGDTRVMLTEAYANISFTMRYYERNDGRKGAHVPVNFLLITDLSEYSDARDFMFTIQKWLTYKPLDATPNWVIGNHDRPRIASTYGEKMVDAMNMLLLTLPGVAVTYNGEEIGMLDNRDISWEDTKDPIALNINPEVYELYTRDPARTPFQWDDSENAGFSDGNSTWLRVHANYKSLNLRKQKNMEKSHYKHYVKLANLRKQPTFQRGSFVPLALSRNVLSYKRELKDHDLFVVVINLSAHEETVNLQYLGDIPDTMTTVISGCLSSYQEGHVLLTNVVVLEAHESLVLKGVPKFAKINKQTLDTARKCVHIAILGLMTLAIWKNKIPESYDIIYIWREYLDDYTAANGGDTRVMLTEAYANISFTMRYYERNDGRKGAHVPVNFLLITDLSEYSDARDFMFTIQKWLTYKPLDATPNWVIGNHDRPRIASTYGEKMVDAMNMLLLTLPGVAVTYNGEEIGMLDNRDISWEDTKDPIALNINPEVYELYTRDPARTPFQWDDSENAGFSDGNSTWLRVHANYKSLNLRKQKNMEKSHYKHYVKLANLRKQPTFQRGSFVPLALSRNVLSYKRELKDHDLFVVVINLSAHEETVNLQYLGDIPDTMTTVISGCLSSYQEGHVLLTNVVVLEAHESLVLKGVPKFAKINKQTLDTARKCVHIAILGLMTLAIWKNKIVFFPRTQKYF